MSVVTKANILGNAQVGTPEYVVAHAHLARKHGRRPSMAYGTIKNPHKALAAAKAAVARKEAQREALLSDFRRAAMETCMPVRPALKSPRPTLSLNFG